MKIVKINSKLYKETIKDKGFNSMNELFIKVLLANPKERIFLSTISNVVNGKNLSVKQHLMVCKELNLKIDDVFMLVEE